MRSICSSTKTITLDSRDESPTGFVQQSPLSCTPALKTALDEAKAALGFAPLPNRNILTNAHGGRMIYRTMADAMIKERKRLGLMLYDQHALRYRGVMELAWCKCDDDEIAGCSGHTTKAMIAKYAGEARQIMRARQAAAKRLGTERTRTET